MPLGGIGTAALLGGGLSALGSVGSGLLGYFGAKSAAGTQAQYQSQALALQQQALQYNQGLTDWMRNNYSTLYGGQYGGANIGNLMSPYTGLGTGAANTLSRLYGFGGQGTAGATGTPDYSSFFNSPDYQWARDQGLSATTNVLNAQGNLLTGSGLKSLTDYGSGLASQQYGNYFNRLTSLAGIGQNAAQFGANNALSWAGAGNQLGSTAGNLMNASVAPVASSYGALGSILGAGTAAGTNALTGGLTNLGSSFNQTLMSNALLGYFNRGAPMAGPTATPTGSVPYLGSPWG